MKHTVQKGECLYHIAKHYGFTVDKLWNDPANSALKEKRKNPNILHIGDVIEIPEKEKSEQNAAEKTKNKFVKTNTPIKLRVRFQKNGKPRGGEAYKFIAEGQEVSDALDGDGVMEQTVSPSVTEATVKFTDTGEEFELAIGSLPPIDLVAGYQVRLKNLGLYLGEANGDKDAATINALQQFQRANKIHDSGVMDSKTEDALKKAYGC